MGGGIGDIGAAAENRDRQARVDRPTMGAGIDAKGEAADDHKSGRGQFLAELTRHLAPVAACPPGPDNRYRLVGRKPRQQSCVAATAAPIASSAATTRTARPWRTAQAAIALNPSRAGR